MSVDIPHFPENVYCRACNLKFGEHERRVDWTGGVYLHERCYSAFQKSKERLVLLWGGRHRSYVEME